MTNPSLSSLGLLSTRSGAFLMLCCWRGAGVAALVVFTTRVVVVVVDAILVLLGRGMAELSCRGRAIAIIPCTVKRKSGRGAELFVAIVRLVTMMVRVAIILESVGFQSVMTWSVRNYESLFLVERFMGRHSLFITSSFARDTLFAYFLPK